MLVLRRPLDSVVLLHVPGLEGPIEVHYVKHCLENGSLDIKIGFDAPDEVQIVRGEIAHLFNPETGERI
jgi:sRNA-binding carbon storage regulator CsrA